MTGLVYHFTDTARLPWILLDRELKPGRNKIGGFPDPDFLWATKSNVGDRTASGAGQAYREGRTMLVRFDLDAEDFVGWPEATNAFPAWTHDQIRRLEKAAGSQADPSSWRCRSEPLPLEKWRGIFVRSYFDPRWRPMPLDTMVLASSPNGAVAIATIHGRDFGSRQITFINGAVGYELVNVERRAA